MAKDLEYFKLEKSRTVAWRSLKKKRLGMNESIVLEKGMSVVLVVVDGTTTTK
jgi:hypothetical protein